MSAHRYLALSLLLSSACADSRAALDIEHKARAERFLRGVYGCDPSVVEQLASEDIVTSYPIFQTIFETPVLRGREAVVGFVHRFCERWTDARLSIHDTVAEGDRVVFLWSFEARPAGAAPNDPPSSWGGITLFRFDETGKIVAEVGEESDPGPADRLATEAP